MATRLQRRDDLFMQRRAKADGDGICIEDENAH
jgi:hypothetical protein